MGMRWRICLLYKAEDNLWVKKRAKLQVLPLFTFNFFTSTCIMHMVGGYSQGGAASFQRLGGASPPLLNETLERGWSFTGSVYSFCSLDISVSASIPETGWATLFDFETSKKRGGVCSYN